MDKNSGNGALDEDLGSSDGGGANSAGTCFNGLYSVTILSTPQHAKGITLLVSNLFSLRYQAKKTNWYKKWELDKVLHIRGGGYALHISE